MEPRPDEIDVSFIVPTRNSARTLESCLKSLSLQQGGAVEIIVVDNHSTDSTPEIARANADQYELFGPERCPQRNHGSELATGRFIAFIDSDMVLEPSVAREAVDVFNKNPHIAALVIPERAFGTGPWIAARRLEKESYLGNPNVEAVRFFRPETFAELGGFNEDFIAGEDWELTDRLSAAGHQIGRVTSAVWHDEGYISLRDAFQKKRYYGRTFLPYLAQPSEIRRSTGISRLRPMATHLLRSPVRGVGLLMLKSVEAAGFALGASESRRALAK